MAQTDRRKRIAISGATGFLGRAVSQAIAAAGHEPVPVTQRSGFWQEPGQVEALLQQLAGCAALVNCAGRAHVANPAAAEDAEWGAFAAANRDLPHHLALAARDAGVGRLVHVSSVAAITNATSPGETVDDRATPAPRSAYGRSKLAGDEAVLELASAAFSPLVLRPPAIYGPGARGWFPAFMRAARLGLPLPLGAIANRRSFAFVGNVADAVVVAATGTAPPGGAYILCDSPPMSSSEFYDHLCRAFGHRGRVWRLPPGMVKTLAGIALGDRAASLVGDAAFDGSHFSATAGWAPPHSLDQAMHITATGHPC